MLSSLVRLVLRSNAVRSRRALTLAAGLAIAAGSVAVRAQGGGPSQLPPQAAAQAEAQVEGELEVLVEDSASGARLRHFLHVGTERLALQFASTPPAYQSGTRLRARGRLANGTLALAADPGSVQVMSLATANTFGEQKVLVILVNFRDRVSTPYSWTDAHATTFGTTSDFFRENSFGQTWLTGSVVGWFTLAMDSTNCDTNLMASLADSAATAAGANLSEYPRRVYAFPDTPSCGWWGLGSVGGNPSRSWVNGSYQLKVVAHELGHNFGNYHSRSESCEATSCVLSEYGDDRDIMGGPATGHMTAFQKERLGWLDYGSSPAIRTVTASGVYALDPYAAQGTAGAKALKVLKSVDGSGRRTFYYVEARTQTGFDATVSPGVLVHTGSEATGNSSNLFDLDRNTAGFDPVLDVGQTYTDAGAGVSIRTLSSDAIGAMVEVVVAETPCSAAAPTVTVSPSGMVTTSPEAEVNYSVSVRNNDGSNCVPATFTLSTVMPASWAATLGAGAVTLAPGASSPTSLAVVSAASASGMYSFQTSASRSGPSATATTNVMVASALDVSLTVSPASGNSFQFSAAVRVGGAPAAGASVVFAMTDPAGRTTTFSGTTNGSGIATAKYRPKRGDPSGTYRVVASASSGSLNGTASATFVN